MTAHRRHDLAVRGREPATDSARGDPAASGCNQVTIRQNADANARNMRGRPNDLSGRCPDVPGVTEMSIASGLY